jgi:ParB/RepB/Spo0J family partition protein
MSVQLTTTFERDPIRLSGDRVQPGVSAMKVVQISIDDLRLAVFARPVNWDRVRALAASILEIGLQQPVIARKARVIRDGREVDAYEIIAGGHRVAACRQLEICEVPTIVVDVDDLTAELIEIDENLIRENLTAAQMASAISRRKEIYETLHPETRAGVAGAVGRHGAVANLATAENMAERFTKATADATGTPERSVQRAANRGERIGVGDLAKIAGTSLDKGVELDALAKLSPEDREALIAKAEAGEQVSAVEYKRPRSTGFARLMSAWERADAKARLKFQKKTGLQIVKTHDAA